MLNKVNKFQRLIADAPKLSGDSPLFKDIKIKTPSIDVISYTKATENAFNRFKRNAINFIKQNRVNLQYLLLAIPIIASFILVKEIQRRQSLNSRAGLYNASVYFGESNSQLPNSSPFSLWINSNSGVTFAKLVVKFDQNLIRLTSDPEILGSLTRKIQTSTLTEANSSGRISLILALDPSNKNNAPNGAFQVANLKFEPLTTNPNVTTAISFLDSEMQIVAKDASVFLLTSKSLNLIVNPVATPTPTSAPTATTTTLPQASTTPQPSDTAPPTVNITSPLEGESISSTNIDINVTADDVNGIAKIDIFIDNDLIGTCTGKDTCNKKYNSRKLTAGVHTVTAKATDNSKNESSSNRTINILE